MRKMILATAIASVAVAALLPARPALAQGNGEQQG